MARRSFRTLILVASAVAVAAFTSAEPTRANIISTHNCIILPLPCFRVAVTAPGGDAFNLNETSPIIQSTFGPDGTFGSGKAFGKAGLGTLGGSASALNDAPLPDEDFVESFANVAFDDIFRIPSGIVQPAILQISVDLQGTTTVTGGPDNFAGVEAGLSLSGETSSFDHASGPGTLTVAIPIFPLDLVLFGMDLGVSAQLPDPGGATADFSNTMDISKIALLDLNGNFLQDITLVDLAGNTLRPSSSTAAPEAPSLAALGGLLLTFPILYRRRHEVG